MYNVSASSRVLSAICQLATAATGPLSCGAGEINTNKSKTLRSNPQNCSKLLLTPFSFLVKSKKAAFHFDGLCHRVKCDVFSTVRLRNCGYVHPELRVRSSLKICGHALAHGTRAAGGGAGRCSHGHGSAAAPGRCARVHVRVCGPVRSNVKARLTTATTNSWQLCEHPQSVHCCAHARGRLSANAEQR